MTLMNQMNRTYLKTCWKALIWREPKYLKYSQQEDRWHFLLRGLKSHTPHVITPVPVLALPLRRINLCQILPLILYSWLLDRLLWKEFGNQLAFTPTALIKVTIKALMIPRCQRAADVSFSSNTSFISECVSVLIIGAVTSQSRSESVCILRASDCKQLFPHHLSIDFNYTAK